MRITTFIFGKTTLILSLVGLLSQLPTSIYAQESTNALCTDGLDNDADGLADCDDPQCYFGGLTNRCSCGAPNYIWYIANNQNLYWVNKNTGIETNGGSRNSPFNHLWHDLAWSPNGTLYAVGSTSTRNDIYMFSSNLGSSVPTLVTSIPTTVMETTNSLCVGIDGNMYLGGQHPTNATQQVLVRYNISSNTFTTLDAFSNATFGAFSGDLAFINNTLYGTTNTSFISFGNAITGPISKTIIASGAGTCSSDAYGLASDLFGNLYVSNQTTLSSISPSNGTCTGIVGLSQVPTGMSMFGSWNSCPGNINVSISPSPATSCGPPPTLTASISSSAGTSNARYIWALPGGGTASTSSISATTSGVYRVTVTDNNCCSGTAQTTVTIGTPPTFSVTPATASGCEGTSHTLGISTPSTGLAPFTYVWSSGGQTTPTITVAPITTTTYFVTVTDAAGCSTQGSRQVDVLIPGVAITPGVGVTVCDGSPVTLNVNASGFSSYSYQWSPGGGNTQSVTVTPTLPSTIYQVTVTGFPGGCTSVGTRLVNVHPRPSATVNPPTASVCNGAAINLTVTATGGSSGYSYLWNTTQTTPTITVSPTSNTTYVTTVTDSRGCTATASRLVTVGDNPIVSISSNPSTAIICNGSSILLNASSSAGVSPFTYVWSTGHTTPSVTVSPTSNTTYRVTMTDASGCSATSANFVVTVTPSPGIIITPPSPLSLCTGASVTLSANTSGFTSYTYLWSNSNETTQSISVTPAPPNQIYTVTVTGFPQGCSTTASRNITVHPLPSVTINPNPANLCSGSTIALTAVPSGGQSPFTYLWTGGSGSNTLNVSPTTTTTYHVTITDARGCTATASRTVNVGTLPVPTINPAAPIICNGQSITLDVSVTSGGTAPFTYVWNAASQTTTSIVVSPSLNSNYSVIVTDALGCTGTASRQVTVSQPPTVTVTPAPAVICQGQSINLTANVSGSTSYSYNWSSPSSLQTINVSPPTSQIYTVTVTAANGCTALGTRLVTVNSLPSATISPNPANVCSGLPITITASPTGGGGTYSYLWSPGGAVTSTITESPTTNTTYSVIITDNNTCTTSASRLVNVNSIPSLNISPATATICFGASITLTANAPTATAFLWGDGSTTSAITVSPATTTTYSVTITDANGCINIAQRQVVVNNSLTVVVTPANANVCQGGNLNITANASGGNGSISYVWNSGLPATPTVNVNPGSTAIYSVTASDANGCTGMANHTVTVNPQLNASIAPAVATVCSGIPIQITGSSSNGTLPFTYRWSNTESTQAITVSPTVATGYSLTITDANGCSGIASRTVNTTTNPVVTINPSSTSICAGLNTTLSASAVGGTGAISYQWLSPNSTSSNITVSPATTTTYTVVGTDVNGCSGTNSSVVTVFNNPVPAISPSNPFICIGSSITLIGSATDGTTPYNYSWSQGGTSASINVTPLVNTTYGFTVVDQNGCRGVTSTQVNINQLPTVGITPANPAVCPGGSITLTAISTPAPASYLWFDGSSNATATVTLSTPTSYRVTVTDVNGCTNVAQTTVGIHGTPTVSINPASTSICRGRSAFLVAQATGGAGTVSYLWNPGGNATTSVSVSPVNTTIYSVIGTDSNGCTGSATSTVNVNDVPTATINPSSVSMCFGTSVTLTANPVGGSGTYTYSWTPVSSSNQSVIVSPASTTNYTVVVTDGNNCTVSASRNVTVNQNPSVTITPASVPICAGSSTTLTSNVTGGLAPYTYNWTNSANTSAITVNPPATTGYTLTLVDQNGCFATHSSQVVVNPIPVLEITPINASVCIGNPITLGVQNTLGIGLSTFSWNTSPVASTTQSIIVTPPSTTTYMVTATDVNGCSSTAQRNVVVNNSLGVNITPAAPSICLGTSVNLNAVASGGTGAISYIWSPNAGSSTNPSVSVNPAVTTGYRVTATDLNGCTGVGNVTVTVNSIPTLQINPVNASVCLGSTITLSAVPAGGSGSGYQYLWSDGSTTASISISPTASTNISCLLTDANGCTISATRFVTVNTLPQVTISPAFPQICVGVSTTLTAVIGSPTPISSYVWNTSPVSNTPSIVVGPSSSTSYTVLVTDNNTCTATATRLVTVNANPTVTISPNPANVCRGTAINLSTSVVGGTPSYTYSWNNGAGSTPNINVTPLSTITYTVVVTDANSCTAITSRNVNVQDVPTAVISPASVAVCLGTSATVTASPSGGTTPYSYSWSGNSSITNTAIYNLPSSQNVNLIISDVNGCSATIPKFIDVLPNPQVNVVPPAATICQGASVNLIATASGSNAPYSYRWSNGGLTTANNNVSPLASTVYRVVATDINSCTAITAVTVTVNANPTVTISPNAVVVCQNATVNLSANVMGGTPAYTYAWQNGTSASTLTFVATAPSISTVTVTDINGCTGTASRNIIVNTNPTVAITPPSAVICSGNSISLTANPSGGAGGYSYAWSIPAATPTISVNPIASTTYVVVVTDGNNCTAAASRLVVVNPTPVIGAISRSNPTSCSGSDGSISINGLLPNTPYTLSFAWNGVASTTVEVTNASGSILVENLPAGSTSNVIVTLGACPSAPASTSLSDPTPPLPSSVTNTPTTTCGGNQGTITIHGLTPNTVYDVYYTAPNNASVGPIARSTNAVGAINLTGLTVGTYNDIRVVLNNCSSISFTTSISQPPPPVILITPLNNGSICMPPTGILVTASGGVSYLWNNQTTGAATIYAAVTYNTTAVVTVTDALNCTNTASTLILGLGQPTCNQFPYANLDINATLVNTSVAGNVLRNDDDPEWDPLTTVMLTAPRNGVLSSPLTPSGQYIYTPNSGFIGKDSFSYQLCDNAPICDTTWAYIFVSNQLNGNQAPMAHNDLNRTLRGIPVGGNLLNNDVDPEGDPLFIFSTTTSILVQPGNGTVLTLLPNGDYAYAPNAGFVGEDSFVYVVCENIPSGLCDTATVFVRTQLDRNGLSNDAPFAEDDFFGSRTNTILNGSLRVNDSDPNSIINGLVVTSTTLSPPANGTISISSNGVFQYTPNLNYVGHDQFVYSICDPSGLCDTATCYLLIYPQAPNTAFDINNTFVNTTVSGSLRTNDIDLQASVITYVTNAITAPRQGTVVINPNGGYSYTPNLGFVGLDSFEYSVCNTFGLCSNEWCYTNVTQPVTTITQPIAHNDHVQTIVSTQVVGNVLANDVDPGALQLRVSSTLLTLTLFPSNGILGVLNPNGDFSYTPSFGYVGLDTFEYVVCNSQSLCDTAIVVIEVLPNANGALPDGPFAQDDAIRTDASVLVSGNLASNDSDPVVAFNQLAYTVASNPSNGSLMVNANGTYTYIPTVGFVGHDRFTYTACNPSGLCDSATCYILVYPQSPNLAFDINNTFVNTSVEGSLKTNDFDVQLSTITYQAIPVTPPTNGFVLINGNGSYSFTPSTGFIGLDSFQYRACNEFGLCQEEWCYINVTQPVTTLTNPIAHNDHAQTLVSTSVNGNVLANDIDPGTLQLGVTSTTLTLTRFPSNGTLNSLQTNGDFNYTPASNFVGLDTFEYVVCNTLSLCDTARMVIEVLPNENGALPEGPFGQDDAIRTNAQVSFTGNLSTNDSDPAVSTSQLVYGVATNAANGTASINANGDFTYVPNNGYIGPDRFTYSVCNPSSLCDTATCYVLVYAESPRALMDINNTIADMRVEGNVLTNDNDPQMSVLLVNTNLLVMPSNGGVAMNVRGDYIYSPSSGFVGLDSFLYSCCNGYGFCDTAWVYVHVTANAATNHAPVAHHDVIRAYMNSPMTTNVLSNDSDPNMDALSTTLVSNSFNGSVTLVANGLATYTPNTGFVGLDSFSYSVCDASGLCDTAFAFIEATLDMNGAINDAPWAHDDAFASRINQQLTGTVVNNDMDANAGTLTYTLMHGTNHGVVVVDTNGTFNYISMLGYVGPDRFVYSVCDPQGACDSATVYFTTYGGEPYLENDLNITLINMNVSGNVLTNDRDPNGSPIVVTVAPRVAPMNGTVAFTGGSYVYTPNAGYVGNDSFSYIACNNLGYCDSAWVFLDVVAPSDTIVAPYSAPDFGQTFIGLPLTGNLAATDVDVNQDVLTFSPLTGAQPSCGTVVISSNGAYIYTPTTSCLQDTFGYQVCDIAGTCDTNYVVVFVSVDANGAQNNAPFAQDDRFVTKVNTTLTNTLATNDFDPEANNLSFIRVTNPVNGNVTIQANGNFVYVPFTGYVGPDRFVYSVCDTAQLCDTATVYIVTLPTGPTAIVDNIYTTGGSVTGNVLTNDSDPANDTFTIQVTPVISPNCGTLVLTANGGYVYTPNSGTNCLVDSFSYSICNTYGMCDTTWVFVYYTSRNVGANNWPIAANDVVQTYMNVPVTGNVSNNDFDPDRNPLTVQPLGLPTNGTIVLQPNGSFTYTPTTGFLGVDTFTYVACDNGTPPLCDTATVFIYVLPTSTFTNQAPFAQDDANATSENTPVSGNVGSNDFEPNSGQSLTYTIQTPPTCGSVVLNTDGSYTFTPSFGVVGTCNWTYLVCDNGSPMGCDSATVSIVVYPFSSSASSETDTIVYSTTHAFCLPTTDIELVNTITGITFICPVLEPNVTIVSIDTATLCITYTGSAVGQDTLCVLLTDSLGLTDTVNIYVTVIPRTDTAYFVVPPVDTIICINQLLAELPGYPQSVVSNNVDINGVNNGQYGGLTDTTCFVFQGNPVPGTMDTLVFVTCNGTYCDTSVVIITSRGVSPPIAVNDTITVPQDESGGVRVLLNDTFGAPNGTQVGDPVIVQQPAFGSVDWNATDSTFVYRPASGYCGQDSFTYSITNNGGLSDTATVYIEIPCDSLVIYNALSPNGDQFNDTWVIENIDSRQFANNVVTIYNRWGNKVFEVRGYNNLIQEKRFEGYWQSDYLPDGTYFYTIEIIDLQKSYTGYLELRR